MWSKSLSFVETQTISDNEEERKGWKEKSSIVDKSNSTRIKTKIVTFSIGQ